MKKMVERMVKLFCKNNVFESSDFVRAVSGANKEMARGNWVEWRLRVNGGVFGTGMAVVGRMMEVKRGYH